MIIPLGESTFTCEITLRMLSMLRPMEASTAGLTWMRTADCAPPPMFTWLTPSTWLIRCPSTWSARL